MASRTDAQAFLAQIVKGAAPPPVVLLTGPEGWIKGKILEQLEARHVAPEARDFNVVRVRGSDVRYGDVVGMARTMPMMSPFRLVVLGELQDARDKDVEVMLDYLKDPSPSTLLVVDAEGADMRRQPFAALGRSATTVECRPPTPREAETFACGYAREHGATLERPAATLLVERVGTDLSWLAGEVDRLMLYVHPAKAIAVAAVEAAVGRSREASVFEYIGALARRDLAAAVGLLRSLVADGEPPLSILALIERQFRMMLAAAEALARRVPAREAARIAGVPGFIENRFMEELRGWPLRTLQTAYPVFLRKDQEIKSRGVSALGELELLTAELLGL